MSRTFFLARLAALIRARVPIRVVAIDGDPDSEMSGQHDFSARRLAIDVDTHTRRLTCERL